MFSYHVCPVIYIRMKLKELLMPINGWRYPKNTSHLTAKSVIGLVCPTVRSDFKLKLVISHFKLVVETKLLTLLRYQTNLEFMIHLALLGHCHRNNLTPFTD
jgi:hypothetical protein